MSSTDPREILATAPMSRRQWAIVVILVAITAIDGFNVQSISFASLSIAKAWGITKAALGVVLSTELAGMAVGAYALGKIADKVGRRPVVLGALVTMAVGMGLAGVAGSIAMLTLARLVTGVGVGAMLAVGNSLVAEVSHARRRALSSALMMGGFPLGAVLGGMIATSMLGHGAHWHSLFLLGAVATTAIIPVAWWLVPESTSWLASRGDLEGVNRVLRRLGHADITSATAPDTSIVGGWNRPLAISAAILTALFFLHSMTFYFFVKWLPALIGSIGMPAQSASSMLVWCNVGGVLGAITLSILTLRLKPAWLVAAMMAFSATTVALVNVIVQPGASPSTLTALAFVIGFMLNAGVVGSYGLMSATFPTAMRASGTGLVIGIGRIGSVLGPIIAGTLLQAGLSFGSTAVVMACGSLLGAALTVQLARRVH